MAVIDSKKLLPPSKSTGSALTTQKFLVPISNTKVKSSAIVRASDITPVENERVGGGKTLLGEVIQIRKNVISIQKVIADNNTLFKKSEERKRKLLEKEKFAKKEQQLEKKDPKQKTSLSIPSLPRTGFLDAIKRFLFYTLLGAAFVKFGKHIPKILEFSKKLIPAFKFVEDFAGNVLNGVVDFVGAGYKAYDKVREITKQVGGEDLEKKFDEFSKQFNTFANLALIAGMSTMGGTDFSGGRGKPSTTKPGFDRVRGGRVSKPTQARYLSRYGKGAFTNRFGQQSLRGLTGKGVGRLAGKALGRVPIIGGLVDFIISTVIFKEKPGRAAAKAVGATIGSALGTFIPIPFAGTILGGVVGDLVGGALYDSLVGNDTLKAKAQGGQVTRGGQRASGPARRSIRRVRTRPPKIKPQKTIPGKDIGGKEEIKKIFPSPANPNQRNPLGVLETTSKNLKEVPLLGGIMGASVDLAMGQKPDASVFRRIGYGFGALVQNAIDAETSNTIGNIQKELVGLAGGGSVPRTLSTGESIGMQIGERLGKTLEAMMNSKVTETLQSIRQQFGKAGFGFGSGGGPGGGPGGELDADQQEAFEKIRKIAEKVGSPNPSVTAAIAMIESGWLSNPNSVYFASGKTNPFGQSGRGPKGSVPGRNGQEFAVYNNLEEGVKAHVDRWKSSYIGNTPEEIIENIRRGAGPGAPGMYNNEPGANWTAKILSAYRSGTQPKPSKVSSAAYRAILPEGNPVLTSGFGLRKVRWGSKYHRGVDIGVDRGSRVLSAAAGTAYVLDNATWGSFGQAVVVDHGDGTSTIYGHVDPIVKNGQKVKKGDTIAKVKFWPKGAYGAENEDNTHLHFERRLGGVGFSGKAVDPSGYLNSLIPKPTPKPAQPPSPPPSQVRTRMTRSNQWKPEDSGLIKLPDGTYGRKASLAPSTSPSIASGVNQKAFYEEIAGGSTLILQKVITEKPVPTPMNSGGSVAFIDNSTLPITAFLS